MKNISALMIVFTFTTTLCARDKELDNINQLFDHALYEDATFKAIDIYNKSQSDDDKAECLYLLHELAKKRELSETAKEEKRKLLLYFPNSTFAQKVIAKDQENINAALQTYLSKDIDISTSWNFFGIKSGMTKAEVNKVLFPRLRMLNIRISDEQEYYKDGRLYNYKVTLSIPKEANEQVNVYAARSASIQIAFQMMYTNADISYSWDSFEGSLIELEFTDDHISWELNSEKLKEATDVLFATDVEIKEIQEEERRKKEEDIRKKEEEEQRKKDDMERLRIAREKEEQEKKEKAFLASIFVAYEKPENLDSLTESEVIAYIHKIDLGFKKYNEISKNFPSQISSSIESKVNKIRITLEDLKKKREEFR